jgi:tRNA threonylcarbamoyladenosine biosynthesis protein TsaB
MKILAIETSASASSVALLNEDEMLIDHKMAPLLQSRVILLSINELLLSSQVELEQLDAVAFGCGPGSFTGIRIATGVAQGLGYAANLPLIAISSLAALAQAVCDDRGWKKLLVAVDARMHELFWGVYTAEENGLMGLFSKESLCSPNLIDVPPAGDWYGVGTGWGTYQNNLIQKLGFQPIEIDAVSLPTAAGVARLALAKCQREEWVSAAEAQPVYLRDKVVFSPS